jgi:TolB-like protein/Flp pilus assembly protein TadD
MSAPVRPSFWEELRRRRVVRAITVYALVAWVAVQVADVFFPALRMPDWTVTLVAVLALVGFPITVALAWVFDRTPEGLLRTEPAEGVASGAPAPAEGQGVAGGRLDGRLVSALALGVLLGVVVVGTGTWLAGELSGGRTGPSGPGVPVVAVLPFETVGEASTTFTEGIHGDVLTRLSGVEGVDVISRGSVLRYRESLGRPVGEIAEELGVGWVLRGEVQRVGEQVQVHARLVDAHRDRQVWAEAFRRDLTAANLFDIQQEITHQIAAALERRLRAGPDAPSERPTTEDLEAYRLYVQGRGLLGSREEDPMRRAVSFFRRAVERDPEYAEAWAGLADALIYLETFGYETPEEVIPPRRAAERALALDPELAEGHFALANLAHARRDNPEAIRRSERAIELRPSYSDAYNLLSWIHKQHGRVEPAVETAERAVELDPLGSAPLSNLSLAHLARGDAAGAVHHARRVRELHPDFSTGAFLEGLALYHQGRFAEARPRLHGVDVAWAPAAAAATRALADLALGDTAAARATLSEIDGAAHPFSHALVRSALGDTAGAMEAIAAIERWEYWPTFALRYFFPEILGPLRGDPRYAALLERVDRGWSEGGAGP